MHRYRSIRRFSLATALVALVAGSPCAAFDLQYTISNPSFFTAHQLDILNAGLAQAEDMWESVITGYQPNINIPSIAIEVRGITTGLADANVTSSSFQGGFSVTNSGRIRVNRNEIENFANWQGAGANGLNFIDELMAHETGHVLGIGILWIPNNLYVADNSYRYTGPHGVAAYQEEFDSAAAYIPVENAGNPGTPGSHWDQRMRSSAEEGTPPPANPFLLDPRVGVTDRFGHDRGLELMTGAIDPDYGEPFLSRFTVQSMRDMGYTVAEFEDVNADGTIDSADLDIITANQNQGMSGLGVDSIRFGDVNRDRMVDMADFGLVRATIPEPSTAALAAIVVLAIRFRRGRRTMSVMRQLKR